ncbi:restriction endonuclease [Vogesella indigofera]|uniref:restriction endonuclease n=1 Tax=Vogesella indigofera TaxID=45465 RepID=UPI00234ECBE2|nr:restriction endonuclease [Vogesella indigofera]MDC7701418.1 restriction endonuclease [Vogesella indigofera]
MNFGPGVLADGLSETAGYKAGLALSIEELCDHLTGTEYPDIIRRSEEYGTRLRSEEYEALFYKLLYRIGYTEEEYDGDHIGIKRIHKYRRMNLLHEYEGMHIIFREMWMDLINKTLAKGSKAIDPTPFLIKCREQFGKVGLQMAMEQIEVMNRAFTLSPHSIGRSVDWTSPLALKKLFTGARDDPEGGKFIDQRFVNYLSNNHERMPEIHWRKFEELTAEFFHREGYQVKLGPGSNDDGVDVRVWKQDSDPADKPLCLVQCKRQKAKVDRVIVKGLHADVEYEGAEYGVIVTTSELSPAARSTVTARGYPIREVEREGLKKWLSVLRTPGTGIIRL